MKATTDARKIAASVAMPYLLSALDFDVNERTRRCACRLHGGLNRTAFSWREDGRWHCFSCGRGGDRIALVQVAKQCGFREAVTFLAGLAGVEFQIHRPFRAEMARKGLRCERTERAVWQVSDSVHGLRRFYNSAMLRADRLCWSISERVSHTLTLDEQDPCWSALARLAPAQTFFFAAWYFFFSAPADALARAALASPGERRAIILTWEPAR